ncbi:bifunctional UDP-N-acetylglucosamine diphosphorylase/glucosamine-1-phosphate N-acetyltransferase GlmU, partial [Meiothermus luteus]|uniref:bifunctional UDP-N-acetylglucosamine diphosphorylase/glucosamine-1-phosphate N-acetyltransferase GlmU n=1 Tax=Meiothermus luteus TaxID=2026184 RepID=UPI0011C48147
MAHAVVILAAGLGTRMKSKLPKVLHPLLGRPLVGYCIETAFKSGAERVVVVVGHGAAQVRQAFADQPGLTFVEQKEQLGTAHALAQAESVLAGFPGPIVVTQGDTPLTRVETLKGLVEVLRRERAGMALLTMRLADPTGYGRIVRDEKGEILRNVEQKDATPEEQAIQEINPGVYCFDGSLWEKLKRVDNRNAANEYYLPDLIRIYREAGEKVASVESKDPDELLGINSRAQLAQVERVLLERLRAYWMAQGVRMVLPESIYLEPSVELAPDVTLWPGVVLRGQTRLGEGV